MTSLIKKILTVQKRGLALRIVALLLAVITLSMATRSELFIFLREASYAYAQTVDLNSVRQQNESGGGSIGDTVGAIQSMAIGGPVGQGIITTIAQIVNDSFQASLLGGQNSQGVLSRLQSSGGNPLAGLSNGGSANCSPAGPLSPAATQAAKRPAANPAEAARDTTAAAAAVAERTKAATAHSILVFRPTFGNPDDSSRRATTKGVAVEQAVKIDDNESQNKSSLFARILNRIMQAGTAIAHAANTGASMWNGGQNQAVAERSVLPSGEIAVSERIVLLLNIYGAVASELSLLETTPEGDARFSQGTEIMRASLQKLASVYALAPTTNHRFLIEGELATDLTELETLRLGVGETRARDLSGVISMTRTLLDGIRGIPTQPDTDQLAAQSIFATEGAAFHAAMRDIYNLTNDTGEGMPLDNATRTANGIKQVSDEYAEALAEAQRTGNFSSPRFIEAARRMGIMSEQLTQVEAVRDPYGTSGGGGGIEQFQQIASTLSQGGAMPTGATQGLASGLQALNQLSQLQQQGASSGSFTNIMQAISQSGMLGGENAAQLNQAIGAFGQVHQLLTNNQGGAQGLLQGAQQVRNLFRSSPTLAGRGSGGLSDGGGGGGGQIESVPPTTVRETQTAAGRVSSGAGAAAESSKKAADKAGEAQGAGDGTPQAIATLRASGGEGGGGGGTPLSEDLAGSNKGVPVNVLEGTAYFNLVVKIKDIDTQICKHVANIDRIEQLIEQKYFKLDPAAVKEALETKKKELKELEKQLEGGRKDTREEPKSYNPTIGEHVDELKASAFGEARKTVEDAKEGIPERFRDSLVKTFDKMILARQKDTEPAAALRSPFKGTSIDDVKTWEDYMNYIDSRNTPQGAFLAMSDLLNDLETRGELYGLANYTAHQAMPASVKCKGPLVKGADGRDVCPLNLLGVDPEAPNPGAVQVTRVERLVNDGIDDLRTVDTDAEKKKVQEAKGAADRGRTQNPDGGGVPPPSGDGGGDWLDQLLRALQAACQIKPDLDVCGGQDTQPPGDTNPPTNPGTPPNVLLSHAPTTINGLAGATVTWLGDGATACRAENGWTSYGSTGSPQAEGEAGFVPGEVVRGGSALPATCVGGVCSERVFFPNVFRLSVEFASPVSERELPDQSRAFTTTLAMLPKPQSTSGTQVTQTTVYRPIVGDTNSSSGALSSSSLRTGDAPERVSPLRAGDLLRLNLNDIPFTFTLGPEHENSAGVVTAEAVAKLIRDAMAQVNPLATHHRELQSYTFAVQGETLVITRTGASDTTLSTFAEYKLACSNSVGESKDGMVITFSTSR